MTWDELLNWKECLFLGISRCVSPAQLEEYYRRWRTEIEAHQDREEIIGRFRERKIELMDALRGDN